MKWRVRGTLPVQSALSGASARALRQRGSHNVMAPSLRERYSFSSRGVSLSVHTNPFCRRQASTMTQKGTRSHERLLRAWFQARYWETF